MRICRDCTRDDSQVEFKPKANICKECFAEYLRKYRQKHKQRLAAIITTWKRTNRDHYRMKNREHYATPIGKAKHVARVTKTPRTWLGHILSCIRRKCKSPGPHDPKSGPPRDFEITLDLVVGMWESQAGRCALTRVPLVHSFGNPHSASIDRKDSALGYVVGNVQLVCQWVNRAKHTMSNAEFLAVLDAVVENYNQKEHAHVGTS